MLLLYVVVGGVVVLDVVAVVNDVAVVDVVVVDVVGVLLVKLACATPSDQLLVSLTDAASLNLPASSSQIDRKELESRS